MNRAEATSLLREINAYCGDLGEQDIMLMPPNADDVLSHSYQQHIKATASEEVLLYLRTIAEKHNLTVANEPKKNLIIIYRPIIC